MSRSATPVCPSPFRSPGQSPLDDRTRSPLTATANGSFFGSLPWASPEQVQGRIDELSTATDIYSLGVIAYQVLTARFPYDVDGSLHSIVENIRSASAIAPSRHRAELHPDVDAIVLRCLEKDPKSRYASAADLAVVHAARGNFGESRQILENAVLTTRGSASRGADASLQCAEALALHRLGELAVREHRLDDAASHLEEALPMLEHALENLWRGLPPTDDRLAELQRCLDGLATGRETAQPHTTRQ